VSDTEQAGKPARRAAADEKQSAATDARVLLRTRRSAALATALVSDGGRPFSSLVTIACDCDGSPILLLSTLSDHTRNLDADPRASLLLEDASRRANPQTGPRLTLLGRITPDAEPRLRRRFLARHPAAALYAGFADFRIFRMTVDGGHWVGGFAKARRLEAALLLANASAALALAEAEASVLEHMNADHADAIDLCARWLLGRAGSGWTLLAIDPEGCDLGRGGTAFVRLPFPRPATDGESLRQILVTLTSDARNRAAAPSAGSNG
jgi:putative heme iron utilization protein